METIYACSILSASLLSQASVLHNTRHGVLFAPDYKEHQFSLKTTLEGFKGDIRAIRTGFPDFHLTIEDITAECDRVWLLMTARGTNLGPFMGPPTGKMMTITVMDVCRFENGKIVEHWGSPDRFALMVQLGLLPQFNRNGA